MSALVLQVVNPDSGAVLLDLNGLSTNPTGPGFSVLLDPDWGQVGTQVTWLSQPPFPGAIPAVSYDPVAQFSLALRAKATSYDQLVALAGQLQALLLSGGTYQIQVEGSSRFYYMDVYPSPTPQLIRGQPWGYLYIVKYLQDVDGLPLVLARHPYFRWPMLMAAVNALVNGTMLEDSDLNGIPDAWAWDSVTGLSAHSIDSTNSAYSFAAATSSTLNFRQSATAAPGQTWSFAYDAAASLAGIGQMQAVVEFLDGGGAVIAGGTATGPLIDLSALPPIPNIPWSNRLTVAGTAPAGTAAVRASCRITNLSANTVTVYLRRGQLEQAPAASDYRSGIETVSNNEQSTFGRHLYVYNPSPLPALTRVVITPIGGQVMMVRMSRRSAGSLSLPRTLIRQVTYPAGSETTTAADADATGGQAAVTAPATAGVLLKRWRWDVGNLPAGGYRIDVAIFVDAATQYTVQARAATFQDGASAPIQLPLHIVGDPDSTAGQYQIYTLGTVRLNQPSFLAVEGWASQVIGTGTIHWDQAILPPSDEQVLLVARPELYTTSADSVLGSQMVSPPSDPGGLNAGGFTPLSNLLTLRGNNQAGGTPPDAGIVYPAGTHIVTFTGAVLNINGPNTTQTFGVCRIWNRTSHSVAPGATGNVVWVKNGPNFQSYNIVVAFVADGISAYQFQTIQTIAQASGTTMGINEASVVHSYTPLLVGQSIVMDGLARQRYQTGANKSDVASTMILTGTYLELAPQATSLVTVTLLGPPDPGVGTPDPTAPSAKFVPTQTATVEIDPVPRSLIP